MYDIGFIDEDEGQRSQFYHTFKDDFVVHLIKPKEGSTATELVLKALAEKVQLLVIDFRMNEFLDFNGDSVVRALETINPELPVIVLTSHKDDALDSVDDFRMVFDKSVWEDPEAAKLTAFKKNLKQLIGSYELKVNSAETRLKELNETLSAKGLEGKEEDEYIALNTFLEQVLGQGARTGRQFYSKSTNDRLDALMAGTQELLEKIKEVNASI